MIPSPTLLREDFGGRSARDTNSLCITDGDEAGPEKQLGSVAMDAGLLPPITSIITLPHDIYGAATKVHSEILLYNTPRLAPHYFIPDQYLDLPATSAGTKGQEQPAEEQAKIVENLQIWIEDTQDMMQYARKHDPNDRRNRQRDVRELWASFSGRDARQMTCYLRLLPESHQAMWASLASRP